MIPWLGRDDPFPALETALDEPNGLLAAGGDLSVPRLLEAYRLGVFPWFNPGDPILWWSPNPRMVLFPNEFKCARSLRKRVQRGDYEVRVNNCFSQVMMACAAPRGGQTGTWISPEMVRAYTRLHEAGHAYSFETWMPTEESGREQGAEARMELVGGLYGVALGHVFFGESMFSRKTDASKMALVHLVEELAAQGVEMIDCQMSTPHLASLGAREIARDEFSRTLARLTQKPTPQLTGGRTGCQEGVARE